MLASFAIAEPLYAQRKLSPQERALFSNYPLVATMLSLYDLSPNELLAKAKGGDVDAMLHMGIRLNYGMGFAVNAEYSNNWLALAAEKGNKTAEAICYLNGIKRPEDDAKGFAMLTAEDNKGINPIVKRMLGLCYQEGYGCEKDPKKAYGLYQMAYSMGEMIADYRLARCWLNGVGVTKNLDTGVEFLRQAANAGNAVATAELADCYEKGISVDKDGAKAEELYTKAEKFGVVEGWRKNLPTSKKTTPRPVAVASATPTAAPVVQPVRPAVTPTQTATTASNKLNDKDMDPKTKERLGLEAMEKFYRACFGIIDKQDEKEAQRYLLKALDYDCTEAQLYMGLLILTWPSRNTVEEEVQGFQFIKRAATAHDVNAMYVLGLCYILGKGIDVNYEEAVKWFTVAQIKGHPKLKEFKVNWFFSDNRKMLIEISKAEWAQAPKDRISYGFARMAQKYKLGVDQFGLPCEKDTDKALLCINAATYYLPKKQ